MRPKLSDRIYGDLRYNGVPTRDVWKAMGFKSERTFYSRMANPDTFTAREIRILRKFVRDETADMITR